MALRATYYVEQMAAQPSRIAFKIPVVAAVDAQVVDFENKATLFLSETTGRDVFWDLHTPTLAMHPGGPA